ncbi:O-succinylhomoserine sulfhydrylase [Falsochrobactrum shanghaiense]|uniref:O-succinylhomoserine sulfhydrylase n=1 Tax=Falsochrobactrum shanghaiense TaxID=2201899 RepID=A0A316JCT3_9HYPH|nr:O-succinylhomoserine sulfhydrylase [Falsochrobactrum shanghaiense]PWL19216.1 O-succinylhomoserine sulfhydrylase [Falsochrobactrum shanghaiense]
MTNKTTRKFRPATQLVRAGTQRSSFAEMSEALFLTQGFLYPTAEAAEARFNGEDPGFIYSRYANPTTDMFEKRMCALEGAEEGRATTSGMAAVAAAILCQVQAGDHVISARAVFGSCRYIIDTILPRYGVEISIIDGSDIENWKAAVRPNTKVMFLESPSNPTLEIIDIAAVAQVANEVGAKLIVDNVFATPLYQKPLELGAHIVVYSTTKHIDGQGRCLGGIVLGDREWIEGTLQDYFRHTGPGMSPFNAWIMLKGLETLSVRVRQMTQAAGAVADFLAGKPGIRRVIYPGRADHPQADVIARQMTGGSTMIAVELEGGKEAAFKFENALELFSITNNLGDTRSMITHPATTTHKSLTDEARAEQGITDGLLRISVGLEDTDDLLEDVEEALKTLRS